MRLREYFHDRPTGDEARNALPSFQHWTPPTQRDNCLDMYIRAVQRDVRDAYKKMKPSYPKGTLRRMQSISGGPVVRPCVTEMLKSLIISRYI